MPLVVKVEEFLKKAESLPVLDTRSPSEYAKGHIPGAISFPLFDDQERAEVGTLYTKKGREQAVLRGLEIVGPKMKDFV
ncbi:MAG: rhodanese-like domain-containing protein, partial [Bacteroidota bacterium]|nr:rhodanese-like domain-containing protein [Bacteroidota bacterium]